MAILDFIAKVSDPLSLLVSIAAIVVTTKIAIRTMDKAATDSRLASTHSEMAKCLSETIGLLEEVVGLLERIALQTTFYERGTTKVIETAHARYVRLVGPNSEKFTALRPRHRVFLPDDVHSSLQDLLDKINDAGRTARRMKPNDEHVYRQHPG